MRPHLTVDELLPRASALLDQSFRDWQQPTAGADHLVVVATTDTGQTVVLKAGNEANVDATVLQRLATTGAPVPRVLASGEVVAETGRYFLAIMTFVEGTLLAEVTEAPHRYLAPLMAAMRQVHGVTTTDGVGPVLAVAQGSRRSWQDYLLSVLSGEDPEFDWARIAQSPWVEASVLRQALDLAVLQVNALAPVPHLSLLHGDLNPYNVFVQDDQITGIIDWSYARYGDPLFDFARLRMNPFIRCDRDAAAAYVSLLNLAPAASAREQTYYLFNLLEYVNWYVLDERPEGVRGLMRLLTQIVASR